MSVSERLFPVPARQAAASPRAGPALRARGRGRRRDRVLVSVLLGGDALAAALAAATCLALASEPLSGSAVLLVVPMLVLMAKLAGLYDRDAMVLGRSGLEELPGLAQVTGLSALITGVAAGLVTGSPIAAADLAMLWLALTASTLVARAVARRLATTLTGPERCLVLGRIDVADALHRRFGSSDAVSAEIVMQLPLAVVWRQGRDVSDLRALVEENAVERVVVAPAADDDDDQLLDALRLLDAEGLRVSLVPRMLEVSGPSMQFDDVDGVPLLGLRPYGLTRFSVLLKRGFDLVGAGVLLALVSPIMAAIAVAIKLTSPGPVMFRQQRVGRDGRLFAMLKFRSMGVGADALKEELLELNQAAALFKIANDPRVTRVGRLLRRHSLDELPQLMNVLKGEMSLVGPRPVVPEEDPQFEGWHRWRYHLRPGMTGPWQVLGSTRVPFADMVVLDYVYCANWSLWTDLKLLARTLPYLARSESGERVSTHR